MKPWVSTREGYGLSKIVGVVRIEPTFLAEHGFGSPRRAVHRATVSRPSSKVSEMAPYGTSGLTLPRAPR